jgi:aspartyl-tRNA(Asn)/glutamyl-tRNA(Gln) amidotransferase subunit A
MTHDLSAAREDILHGRLSAADTLAASFSAADAPSNASAYLTRFSGQALAAATAVDAQFRAGAPLPALGGLAVSVKALFDVQGQVTTAASKVLADAPAAAADSLAVARLRQAGAALTGHTHMTEFAFSGVGTNPHHETPANPVTFRLDGQVRIPGGSTSGGAVSVASGAAWAALGSDTGGSIRIPAALQGLVGFKNTARLTPAEGTVPLSPTLDTTCAITRSVRDAVLLHQVLARRRVELPRRPAGSLRLAVPSTLMLDGLAPEVAAAFERALSIVSRSGARIETLPFDELSEPARLNAAGGFAAAESWAWHRRLLATRGPEYDPRVAARMRRGAAIDAADYIDLLRGRADWIARMTRRLQPFDALLSPTVPMVAPLLSDTTADESFVAINGQLLRNPSVVNLLDGCALSLPCQEPGRLPVGLMVWAGAMQDDAVLDVSLTLEHLIRDGEAA